MKESSEENKMVDFELRIFYGIVAILQKCFYFLGFRPTDSYFKRRGKTTLSKLFCDVRLIIKVIIVKKFEFDNIRHHTAMWSEFVSVVLVG